MIVDCTRQAYAWALQNAIRPDSVVLDVGTGTGFFALLACSFGARKVYAIEHSTVIQVAREIAAANGFENRIEFLQGLSTEISLPESVDVIVSDIRGSLPLFRQCPSALIDARRRFLAPGGRMIPNCETLWAAVVEAEETYKGFTQPWDDTIHGIRMDAARRFALNTWGNARVKPEQLLVEPMQWASLGYLNLESPDVGARLEFVTKRDGVGHGLSVWFDAVMADGIAFSNAPGAPETIYGRRFYPWTRPVELRAGDLVIVDLRAQLVGENYIWSWNTEVRSPEPSGTLKAVFRQSTFAGQPFSPEYLRRRSANHVPESTEEVRMDRFILELADGSRSLGDIAARLQERFPDRFLKTGEALSKAADVLEKYRGVRGIGFAAGDR
jgi:protein arginine N-methyltransferase 1